MKANTFWKMNTIAAAVIAGTTMLPAVSVSAQEMVEEIVTTGSRIKARSTTETPAPIDVIGADELANQGDTDISNLLRNSVPSYSVNDQPISDAATLVRPANLRGMAPDHTLLLVNGKRRHRAAVITWLGNGISNGSQGPDAAAIPAMALKNVEVLRDGAAAQYGSDAIAGVINFNLKDASEGSSISMRAGEYSEGDGQALTFAANTGMELGSNGFVNLTFEYGSMDPTSRSEQRDDAQGLIDAGVQGVPAPAMIWGRPIVDDDMKIFVNFGADLGGGTEMYGYTNYNSKNVDGGFFFRNPTNRPGVFADGDGNLLVADTTGDMSGNCDQYAVEYSASVVAGLAADNNCFNFNETIPGGFTPRFGGKITDQTFLMGLKGETDGGLGWDVSTYYGKSKADFHINNTVNASLLDMTPRDFDPGYYQQVDMNMNADFTYSSSETLNWAFGAEYRTEEFTVGAGQEESFIDGGYGSQGFSTSSNGFPGFPAATAGVFDRSNYAVYVESELDASDDLLIQAAMRFEDFEDFGTTTNYKIGANYQMTDDMGVRATYSTGFKAPTPGQSNTSNTSTELSAGVLVNNGTIPATSAVALRNGGAALQPEDATNWTFGVFATVGEFDITVDYFDIDVEDRLNLSSEVELTDADVADLIAEGVPGAGDLRRFRFFTNDFDTNTSGLDVVISTTTESSMGTTMWNLAYNSTKTEVTDYNAATIDAQRIKQIEDTTPETRWNLSANHMMDAWRVLARVSFYDEWFDQFECDVFSSGCSAEVTANPGAYTFDSEFVVDLEVEYDFSENSSLLIGANNVFDNNGQKAADMHGLGFNTASAAVGNTYSTFAPMGFSGAFYYANYRYNF
ncbi:TonB-dependent receptor [Porticoccaceae bacterium]|jgi:iron complex outermembrane receptor protein|nr:TonB-dependent receptor [Porticoccaceae bacterium]